MNKKAINKFVKKINTAKTNKELADIINQGFMDITGAQACWTGLINWETNQIEVRKIKSSSDFQKNKKLSSDVKEIRQTAYDYYKNFEIEDLNEYFELTSKKNIILLPLIYRNNSLGYIGMISEDDNFNKKNIETVNIILEYISSRLEIISLYEERKRSGRERIEFLASISHEFKTPLNSIMGFSDLLAENFQGTENEKYLNNISKSSAYLMKLIQNVLDYTKDEYGVMELKPEKFRAKEIIDDIIWSFEEIRKEKNITFNYILSDVIIKADLIRFKQLVYNLISNAVKFSKENSTISIVTFVNNKKEFTFEIKDRGDGISKKDQAKIFNFFTQVNRSQLKRQQGSGVGLALCRKIVRSHGGEIFVKSKLHYGSKFCFTIPQKKSSR
ncbi:MAG TPA: HAMP domain-containing histidine kinase [Candidatus Stercorousia faecigallinarum]|mgnify:CR=1 FL=1|nr:HAMP domain-containing histidine kinase [Candidatus Stercorousia faecigallinarum]